MVNDVTPQRLRRLARPRSDGAILSFYLDLDPSQLPTPKAREAALDSALHDARRCLEDDGIRAQYGHDALMGLRQGLEEIDRRLRPSRGMVADGARGMAVFAASDGGEIEVLRLPTGVETKVCVDAAAHVEPLVPLAHRGRWCVALVDREHARLYLGDEYEMRELAQVKHNPYARIEPAGENPQDLQGAVDDEMRHHLRRTAQLLQTALIDEDRYDHLVLGTQQEHRGMLMDALHPQVAGTLAGWIDLDIRSASVDDVRIAAAEVVAGWNLGRQVEALDRLQEGVGRDARGTHGLSEALEALTERRVEVLLVQDDLHRPGHRCPTCGLLALEGGDCPADGTPMQPRGDVVEAAVGAAIEQDAEVQVFHQEPRLQTLGGIGAVLRF